MKNHENRLLDGILTNFNFYTLSFNWIPSWYPFAFLFYQIEHKSQYARRLKDIPCLFLFFEIMQLLVPVYLCLFLFSLKILLCPANPTAL